MPQRGKGESDLPRKGGKERKRNRVKPQGSKVTNILSTEQALNKNIAF